VFFDWGMLLHMASHYPEAVPPSMHNILIPSACAAVPYFIRARQCLIMHSIGKLKVRDAKKRPNEKRCYSIVTQDEKTYVRTQNDPKRFQHVANAIKYTTSIFPLFLSAYQKTIDPKRAEGLEGLLIFLLT
jgi:hypothetical protein